MASKELTRTARLDAVESAFEKVATGKAGSASKGADLVVGRLAGSERAAWYNWVWRANPANETSQRTNSKLYLATVSGNMPLVKVKGTTHLVLSGEQVKSIREAYREAK